MQSQLAKIVEGFEAAQARLHRLADRTPEETWQMRSDPSRWSVAECVAHLNLTGEAYVPVITKALAEGRASRAPVPARYKRDFTGWLVGLAVGPLPHIGPFRFGKVRTPTAFVPSGDFPKEVTIAHFDRLQAEQIALTRQGEGLPLQAVFITSPFDRRFRYSLYSCLSFLAPHQMRHLLQAEQVWSRGNATASS